MLGEIQDAASLVEEAETTFQPNREHVLMVVTEIETMLQDEKFQDVRALDILVAVEAFSEHLRQLLGVAAIVAQEVADESQSG